MRVFLNIRTSVKTRKVRITRVFADEPTYCGAVGPYSTGDGHCRARKCPNGGRKTGESIGRMRRAECLKFQVKQRVIYIDVMYKKKIGGYNGGRIGGIRHGSTIHFPANDGARKELLENLVQPTKLSF